MKLPSLQHLLGYAAVLVLVGPSSAQALPGTGTVDSGDIQNGQVKRADIANNAINSSKVAANSLTGADFNESTFGKRFARTYTAAGTTPRTKVASAGGLEIWAGCLEAGDPADHYADIRLRSTVNGAKLSISKTIGTGVGTEFAPGFDSGDELDIAGTLSSGHADVLYSIPSGKVVEAHIDWAGLLDVPTETCMLHGVVVG